MKCNFGFLLVIVFFTIQFDSFSQKLENNIYQTDKFVVTNNRVLQDVYSATAISTTEILSNYQSLKLKDKEALKSWKLTKDISAFPQLTSQSLLENAIYNMSVEEMEKAIEKDSTLRTGVEWPGVWTRDVSYSILLSMAYMQPKVSQNSLMRKVNANGRIIQDTGTGGAWPVSTDRMIWVVAAWEIYKVTGDKNWLKKVYPIIKNSIEDDKMVAYDKKTGLVMGESSFLDWREQTYPRWMQPADIYSSKNLGTNAVHYRALVVASRMAGLLNDRKSELEYKAIATRLKSAINTGFWIEKKKFYGQYLYGRNSEIISPRSEALGEALSVLFDIADINRQKQIVQNTPVVDYGIPCIYPQISDIPPYHNNGVWPFVQTYWLWAGAKTGNEKSVLHSIASIYRAAAMFLTNKENFVADNGDYAGTEINSSNMLWSLSGNISIVHKVLFGIRFEENNLKFQPFVPKVMNGVRRLDNFKYRKAIFDIELNGFGNRIKSFVLDGKLLLQPILPATLIGKHKVQILMANNDFENQAINLVENKFTPLTPITTLQNGKLSWLQVDGVKLYRILKDGKNWNETTGFSKHIPVNQSGEFQVIAIGNDGLESFASEPIQFSPSAKTVIQELENFVTPSPLSYANFSGSGFVEISKNTNQSISIDFKVVTDGLYAIDWRYANGNGPINTENKCAIRTLFVDKVRLGVQVFPHRGTNDWSNWGYSNSIKAHFTKGSHTLILRFMPENENMNIEINQAMLDYVRITRID